MCVVRMIYLHCVRAEYDYYKHVYTIHDIIICSFFCEPGLFAETIMTRPSPPVVFFNNFSLVGQQHNSVLCVDNKTMTRQYTGRV